MSAAVLVVAAGCLLLLVLLYGALVELQRQVNQIRQIVGLVEDAHPATFDPDLALSDLSIPAVHTYPDDADGRAAVLVLSDHCSTCFELAEHLRGTLPYGFSVLVQSSSEADATSWLAGRGLAHGPQVVYDRDGSDAAKLGIKGAPIVVKFEGGRAVSAANVPSTLQLDMVLGWVSNGATHTRGLTW